MSNLNHFTIKIRDRDNGKEITSDLSHVLLTGNNPRYKIISDKNINLIQFLKACDKTQEEILKDLLDCEGDFSDFKRLIESINENGFIDLSDEVLVIQKDNYDYYLVVEGNRRVACLKLLLGLIKIPKYYKLNDAYANERSYMENESEWNDNKKDEESEKRYKNYCDIIETIDNSNLKKNYKEITFITTKDNDVLINFIYSKHLTGEKIGMRKWSRAKHYADLIKWFGENGYNKNSNDVKNIAKKINRHVDDIKRDFEEAQFVYSCFYFGKNVHNDELSNNKVSFNHDDILEDLARSDRISALERKHSYNKVRNIIEKNLGIVNERNKHKEFENHYLNFNYDKKTSKIEFYDHKWECRVFLSILYHLWKKRKITTRPFNDENEIFQEVMLKLNGINLSTRLSYEKINDLDEFSLTIKQIDQVLKVNSNSDNPKINFLLENFKYAKSIKESVKMMKQSSNSKKFDYFKPKGVFKRLIDQMNWNLWYKEQYLNAVGCSLRSFYEQILIWTFIALKKNDDDSEYKNLVKKHAIVATLKNPNELWYEVLNELTTEHGEPNDEKIIDYLNFFIPNYKNNGKIENFFHEYVRRKGSRTLLNNCVHGSHKIYMLESYSKNLKKIDEICKLTCEIYDEINWNVFDRLDEEIIATIQEKNDKYSVKN